MLMLSHFLRCKQDCKVRFVRFIKHDDGDSLFDLGGTDWALRIPTYTVYVNQEELAKISSEVVYNVSDDNAHLQSEDADTC